MHFEGKKKKLILFSVFDLSIFVLLIYFLNHKAPLDPYITLSHISLATVVSILSHKISRQKIQNAFKNVTWLKTIQ